MAGVRIHLNPAVGAGAHKTKGIATAVIPASGGAGTEVDFATDFSYWNGSAYVTIDLTGANPLRYLLFQHADPADSTNVEVRLDNAPSGFFLGPLGSSAREVFGTAIKTELVGSADVYLEAAFDEAIA